PKYNTKRPLPHGIHKPHSPLRRHINRNLSPQASNFHHKVTSAKAPKLMLLKVSRDIGYGLGPKETLTFLFDVYGNPQYALKDKGVIDSACSRHMIGNMSYLFDFEEINGGYVALGGNPKGGKITGDLSCLFAKATLDESNLWHIRLGHINFKTMNKLVKGNLVRGLPSKVFKTNHTCVACKKAKQHRASCFMRPFGCPVTILNTLDPLVKFDEKADEGFYIGYSISSKAFRVFNSRTRIVRETLHINFLENQPNIAGSGPTWLFDIDTLTKSMNYLPVTAGNQPNPSTGIQEHFDADKAREGNVQQYVLFPLWSSGSKVPQNTDDDNTFKVKVPESVVYVSPSSSAKSKKHDDETKREDKGKSHATLDESNLWHIRLGHINFKTMNKLVEGNLVRGLPSKVFENNHTCVACKKGKQHRASCKSKPDSSVSQPLQRILMTKPQNKTPYELLLGRTPSIGFMRPFGCPVTTFNTLDPLGSGPTWVFDIDTLTKYMNYRPVTVGNQPNPSADPQNTDDDTTFEVKEPESVVYVSQSSSAKSKKHDDKTKREDKGKNLVELSTGFRNLSEEFEDFTCLFAKATLDESNLWHIRLGHINLKTMNKLVKGNLVRGLPSKVFENSHTCVACKKGKQHKASYKARDGNVQQYVLFPLWYSSSKDPQNTNDDTTFEVKEPESVVYVSPSSSAKSKKHDDKTKRDDKGKSPIELSTGFRNLSEEFDDFTCLFAKATLDESNLWHIRLCHINFITMNKLVKGNLVRGLPSKVFENNHTCVACKKGKQHRASYPLSKFDEKADEGFLVGYSVSSKAFRVFNSRTRIVQETLHINFLGNQPNITGSGPTWLFDIDTHTNSMNYQPVTAGNQPNPSAGIQEHFDADKVREGNVQQYMLFPLWSSGSKDPQNTDDDTTFKVKELEYVVYVSQSSSGKSKKHDDKTKREDKGKSPVKLSTGYRNFSEEFKDFTYLFAKATLDESNLWHIRLGHINFKTMNKLVKGNLVRGLASKVFENNHTCVSYKKGKQHRASCKSNPVSSVSQPLQRVLVSKPHNKTPYELLLGRTPSIGFMRPFGYLVTILNTLDPLGKFGEKADEGFLVGYSVSSKAFRVFNSRTQIVQETLHINFLENQPNITGSGPIWLFDITTLTKSMNYRPVTAGNQPNLSADPQNTNDDTTFEVKAPESAVYVSLRSSAKSKKHDDKTKREDKGKCLVELST
nr:ribonuclease H-like domain-containing protein [Tanacetum cinerariifolium]